LSEVNVIGEAVCDMEDTQHLLNSSRLMSKASHKVNNTCYLKKQTGYEWKKHTFIRNVFGFLA